MNQKAVRALRKKFIFITMSSIGVVILFLVMLLNVANLVRTRNKIRAELSDLTDSIVSILSDEDADPNTFELTPTPLPLIAPFGQNTTKERIESVQKSDSTRTEEDSAVYVLLLGENGMLTRSIPDSPPLALPLEARNIFESGTEFGSFRLYYYMTEKLTNQQTLIVFRNYADRTNDINWLFYASIVICLGVLIIVFWPVYYLSERMIQPELRNIERQKQFITNASHELKTPLAVIRANTELIELMEGENEWTTSTLRQVDRMNGLIKNLVTIARAEEKADKSALAEVDVSAAVQDTVDTFTPVASQDGKEMVGEIEANVRLVADEGAIRQLASLLLDNAIKYCDDGGKVVAQLSKKGKGIRLVISNSYAAGESIDYSRFFERFYREDSSHNTEKGGYGIGLSIAESIVHSYNGSISATWKGGMISFVCTML